MQCENITIITETSIGAAAAENPLASAEYFDLITNMNTDIDHKRTL